MDIVLAITLRQVKNCRREDREENLPDVVISGIGFFVNQELQASRLTLWTASHC
jgi:hypothetical protein